MPPIPPIIPPGNWLRMFPTFRIQGGYATRDSSAR